MKRKFVDPQQLMQLALEKARHGISLGQTPFGCAIAQGEQILSVAHNTVHASLDITAHAEINALREACQAVGDISHEGAVAATTCEPCPMCMAALHWARVDVVYFGATIDHATAAGFNELRLSAQEVIDRGGGQVKLIQGVMTAQCAALFEEWMQSPNRRVY